MAIPKPVVFHYEISPYGRRVTWYLALRGIEYDQCLQPIIMPRPDLHALGVQYRRVPVMCVGKDIYCDSRLILRKLEELYPEGERLGAADPDGQAIERMLENWTIDGGVFARACQLVPPAVILAAHPNFIRDREDASGLSFRKADLEKNRPDGMAHIKQAFEFLETTLLADGREWLRKTEKPSLADIHAVWALDWVDGLDGALDRDIFTEARFPKVFAWMARFRKTAAEAASALTNKPQTLSGEQVLESVIAADFVEPEAIVDKYDALKFQKGQDVVVWPTDNCYNYKDSGELVALTTQEVVLQRKTLDGRTEVRIHFPRTNFRIVLKQDYEKMEAEEVKKTARENEHEEEKVVRFGSILKRKIWRTSKPLSGKGTA
ncbi:glutathione S-transferase (GST) family protein, conidia-enriched transcript [Histoplasma capsulatum var. duboisii H88]|nr:glutathione S-transferase (GST) family protein, conidia-enriched transcript [Histoplasma capsulatum]QSS53363.1 glutathione S-transferase (GST) family protein, conidia-enriched transcript [Histoplasma capsulatum var. duboisii H88]QSS76053.1 glutathione S-transferase (GST) family protein, conidia-enriched transcript [Histoplasma capsulatum G186AR]